MPETPPPTPAPPTWVVPVVAGVSNLITALAVLALGVRYDDAGKTPGLLIWVGLALIMPSWLVAAVLRYFADSREQRDGALALRMARELAELAKQHGTTQVVNLLEKELPKSIRDSDVREGPP